jgi:hypothetical protein
MSLGVTPDFSQIRACILRGDTVQEWLQDGAQYGEEEPALKLDELMIRVAALRFKSLEVFRQKNLARLSRTNKPDVVEEACGLDVALASWPQDMPQGWYFSIHCLVEGSESTNSDLLYNCFVHYYTTHGHAAVWIRYLAIRLIVSSILIRLLSALPQEPSIKEKIKTCQENINSLANDTC